MTNGLPEYPDNPKSPFYQSDLEGRNRREIKFDDSSLKIGPFLADDYFGDGSFYILYTPGHKTGHISGLVRTTPTTFVFLGGDISHFPGMYRPTHYAPMPEIIPAETVLDSRFPSPCPCSIFTACHRETDPITARTTTFYHVSAHEDTW
jgi:glyoxylase-like metal-dependent hydrolase (beta-lactamase superfamily II)